jgi:hypothetical protein
VDSLSNSNFSDFNEATNLLTALKYEKAPLVKIIFLGNE